MNDARIDRYFLLIAGAGLLAILSSTLSKTPVLPLFAADLGANPAEIGWIVMASTLPGIFISFPAGMLSDRVGRGALLRVSLLVFATAPLAYLGVTEVWQLIAVRFYHGFATAIFGTVATAAIAERYTAERAARLSLYSSITLTGRSVAPFLGGALISLASFDAVFLACALSGGLALATGLLLPADRRETVAPPRRPSMARNFADVIRHRAIRATALTEAAQFLVFGAVEVFLAVYAAAQGIPAWQIGIILGTQLVAIVLTKPLLGWLSDRAGRRPVIIAGLLCGAVATASISVARDAWPLGALGLVFGLGYAAVTSSTAALVGDLARREAVGSAIGVLRTLMDVGQAAGPVIAGMVIAAHGYRAAFLLLGAVLAIAAAGFARTPLDPPSGA